MADGERKGSTCYKILKVSSISSHLMLVNCLQRKAKYKKQFTPCIETTGNQAIGAIFYVNGNASFLISCLSQSWKKIFGNEKSQ